jgi:hypothetical protein
MSEDETMKDIKDIMEKSLNDVVNTIKEEEDEEELLGNDKSDKSDKSETRPLLYLGVSLGFVSVIIGMYFLK